MKKIIVLIIVLIVASSAFTNKQDYYWLGLGCGIAGYSTARIITWNKYSDQPMPGAEEQRRSVSLISGIGTAVIIGASKELIWDWALDKGYPEYEDFEATLIGGIAGSMISYVLDRTFIKRKEKQTAYLNYFHILPTKNSLKFYCQIKF
jgi:hypothetical protein